MTSVFSVVLWRQSENCLKAQAKASKARSTVSGVHYNNPVEGKACGLTQFSKHHGRGRNTVQRDLGRARESSREKP